MVTSLPVFETWTRKTVTLQDVNLLRQLSDSTYFSYTLYCLIQWSRDILTPLLLTVALYHRFCHETKLLLYKITLYSIYFQKSGFEKSANSIGFEWPKSHLDPPKSCFYNISRVVSIFFSLILCLLSTTFHKTW